METRSSCNSSVLRWVVLVGVLLALSGAGWWWFSHGGRLQPVPSPGGASAQAPTSPFAVPRHPPLDELVRTDSAPKPDPDTGFRIYLTLDKLQFLPEQPFFVTVTFANVGAKSVRFADLASPEYGVVEYELLNSAGQRCGVWKAIGEVAFDDFTGRLLQPGGRYDACIDLSIQARISPEGAAPASPYSSSPLWKPGRYALTAVYHGIPYRPEFGGELRSNTVSLEVLDLKEQPAADRAAFAVLSQTRRRGSIWVKLRDEAEAYRRVLEDSPTSGYAAWCPLNLGASVGVAKKYAAAASQYRAVIRDMPRTRQAVLAQEHLAMMLYWAGKTEAAAAFRALEDDPAIPDAGRDKAAFWRKRADKGIFE